MRTLEDIEKEYNIAKTNCDSLYESYIKASIKMDALYDELNQYKLDHKLYHPMSDLEQYIGKNIEEIQLVKKNHNGSFNIMYLYGDNEDDIILTVNDFGHLYYSSLNETMQYISNNTEYGNNEDIYNYISFDVINTYNIVGYLSIKLENEVILNV